jgi:hypothetical protein
MDYDEDEYFRYYVLEYLQEMEKSANTELVRLLKDGTPRVTKKDLISKYGSGKAMIVRETRNHPEILDQYRVAKQRIIAPPLKHSELLEENIDAIPKWDSLLEAVTDTVPGRAEASRYEDAIEQLLTALFYPALTNPEVQKEIHEGRKRIDITYTNTASYGFFAWVTQHYTAPYVFVECKNYSSVPANPELDQLAGRFSTQRGRFGLLICRNIIDRTLFNKRCRDTAYDGRGFVIALDDEDLRLLVEQRATSSDPLEFHTLRNQFEQLVM